MNIRLNTFSRNNGPLTKDQMDDNWVNIESEIEKLSTKINNYTYDNTLDKNESGSALKYSFEYKDKNLIITNHSTKRTCALLLTELYNNGKEVKIINSEDQAQSDSSKNELNNNNILCYEDNLKYCNRNKSWNIMPFLNYTGDNS